ncbi:MAG: SNF2 family helicase [Anaerolineae bacterium]|nr:SNF2 family helicase [Anaerolineae bacterium]
MPLITRQNLNLNHLRYQAEGLEYLKGKSLYESGQAIVGEFTGKRSICLVTEGHQIHTVTLTAVRSDRIEYACSCPRPPRRGLCRHIVAAVWATRDYLHDTAEKNWQYQIELALEFTPRASGKKQELIPAVLLMGLRVPKNHPATLGAYFVSQDKWEEVGRIAASDNPAQAARDVLAHRTEWRSRIQVYRANEPVLLVNLSPEGRHIVRTILGQSHMYYYYPSTSSVSLTHLPLIGSLNIPLYLLEDERPIYQLRIHPEPVLLQAALLEDQEHCELQAGVEVDGIIYTLASERLRLISASPPVWALAGGDTLVQIENANALHILSFLPLRFPAKEAEIFRSKYFRSLNERIPVTGETVSWQVVEEHPVPRLYLTKGDNVPLYATLRFGYGEHEVEAHPRPPEEEVISIPGTWGGIKVRRQTEAELRFYKLLADPKYGLKRAGNDQPGVFLLRARTHPLDFLTRCIPALTEVGFEIYGEKDIATINRHRPVITLNISSGIDWFDVRAYVSYGEQQVSFNEVRKALKRGEKYIKLADGSIGQIPEEWLERYKHLFELAEETADGLRVSDLQLTLLDELLAEAETKDIAPEFYQKRERLRGFERIVEQPLPQGFTGELRPYQKAGYDWLHFLHEYGWGGILADDMGLGKTVQTLAFLQGLKERGMLPRPALLVVPKSLLVNWQREAERFTPGLRFFEFSGAERKKDYTLFEQYDVVITTYGMMLRDIEFLRGYRFTYAILDESQAIKNPLAQTSKAARLLQADHRLCLTGTPVENNTFELWSQFAFLNPGLLGSLEYFKSEFASAIERRDDGSQPAAQLLRRMIYPFILRRTKEQVAPELPPRTERIIYTDLEPAQRKLYNQTRDYYRGLLMGLLEKGEINDVRFKILEGLLRLRQVCIHPQLVDPTYRGTSAKFEILLETLETLRAEGHKALVFSQFVQTLSLLRRELDVRGMRYAYLDGQTQNRQERVDQFQTDAQIPFFLISLKAGGFGLNLTAADYVLHIDPWWNPAVEMQAADRAHRIGQEKPVFIYKFIAKETVEEKILQLQERKRELVEQLIAADNGFFKSLTKEDVSILFS